MTIYLVGFYDDSEEQTDVRNVLAATTSYEAARQRVFDSVEKFKADAAVFDVQTAETETKYEWNISYRRREDGTASSHTYRIEPVELEESDAVPEPRRPEIEKRVESLEKHNDELKAEVSRLKAAASAAQCFLTFYDGGRYEDSDHLLKNVLAARRILEGDERGNSYILEMFEEWRKREAD